MKVSDRVCNQALKEMFRRVGQVFDPEKEYSGQWYDEHIWTTKEQIAFGKWLYKLVKKNYDYMKKQRIDYEVSAFILNWGWRTSDADEQ